MKLLISILTKVLFVFSILEIVFFPSFENLFATFVITIGWMLICKFVLTEHNVIRYPMICIAFGGLAFFYFFASIPVTMIEQKPVCFNLETPYLTFTLQIIYLVSLIIAFSFFTKVDNSKIKRLFQNLNFYYIPSRKGIFLIGLLGLISLAIKNDNSTTDGYDVGYLDKFLEGFIFLSSMPLIFLSVPENFPYQVGKRTKFFCYFFLFLLLISAVLTNRRHYVFLFCMTPLLLLILNKVYNGTLVKIKGKRIILSVLLIAIISGPITNFALAMSVLRASVTSIKGTELLKQTWEAYNDPVLLEMQYRFFSEEQEKFNTIGYTEYYVDNILLNRFCNMKPIDNSAYYMSLLDCTFGDDYMQDKMVDKLLYLLPRPVLSLLFPSFKKYQDQGYGFHDFLINRATKTSGGGYRIGGDAGIGFATFGVFFPIFVVFFYMIFFLFADTMTIFSKGRTTISLFGVCFIFEMFYMFQSNHGFMDDIAFLLRDGFQSVILYLIIINIFKRINL